MIPDGRVHYVFFDSEIGECALAWSNAGIEAVCLPEKNHAALESRIRGKATDAGDADAHEFAASPAIRDAIALIRKHLKGGATDLSGLRLNLKRVPDFHKRVYESLRKVKPGKTLSYGELAERAGSPGASRAVGQAMARNPFPLLVPCHRVLAANGKRGGFTAYGGFSTKEKLLATEGFLFTR